MSRAGGAVATGGRDVDDVPAELEYDALTLPLPMAATVTTPGSSVGMSRQALVMVRVTGVESFGLDVSVVLLARS